MSRMNFQSMNMISHSPLPLYQYRVWKRGVGLPIGHVQWKYRRNVIKAQPSFYDVLVDGRYVEYVIKWSIDCVSSYKFFKVHLTPNFFSLKKFSMLWWLLIRKKYLILSNPRFFMPRWSTENRTKIAAVLAHDRVSRAKGLVTTVTSLREHDNLYFAPFRIVYLYMFGRLDRYWSKLAEICRTDMSLEVAVMYEAQRME